jgi:L-asparaginase
MSKMKKICMIFCGGTITMKRDSMGALMPFYGADDVLKFVPQIASLADITVVKLVNVDSSNIEPSIWVQLATIIQDKKDEFDGFVVTHGTDTMAYTASALSFVLQHIGKPIVFTGAQKPVTDVPSDAAHNLINAVIIASTKPVGICIAFGQKILQANRATKISESSLDAFDTPMVTPMGTITLEPVLEESYRPVIHPKAPFFAEFDSNVIVIQVTPGLPVTYLDSLLESGVHGIIFEGFGPGNMPTSIIPFLHEAQDKKIPVVILSQCRRGITRMQLYEVGRHTLDAGVIPGGDMTVEAAVTKLMWLLAQKKPYITLKRLFAQSLVGEVTNYE